MNINRDLAIIELTDAEVDEYESQTGAYEAIRDAAVALADETDLTVEIRSESDGLLVDAVSGSE